MRFWLNRESLHEIQQLKGNGGDDEGDVDDDEFTNADDYYNEKILSSDERKDQVEIQTEWDPLWGGGQNDLM